MVACLRSKSIVVCISLLSIVLAATCCVPTAATPATSPLPAPMATTAAPVTATPPSVSGAAAGPNVQTVWLYNPAGVLGNGVAVDWLLAEAMDDAGITKPALAGQASASRVEVILAEEPFRAANELFYNRGWTDGLPIVPPTDELVAAMLGCTDLPANQVVAALDPVGGQATVEKIAVNAIMAGCRPEYMPILIAAVEAISDPVFDLAWLGTTTNPDVTMLVINGPIAKQLDINSGANALGRGWRANATIGRALHLIEQNIGGSWPGVNDVSSLGQPGDYSMMLAENELANPWQPLHVERGFTEEQNVVTAVAAEGMHRVLDTGVNGEGFLRRVADYVSARETTGKNMMLILTPFTADKLAKEGWTKESIRQFIDDNARIPLSRYEDKFVGGAAANQMPAEVLATMDSNGMVRVPFIAELTIIVAGGVGEKNALIPLGSSPVSREITLPPEWDALVQSTTE